MLEVVARDLAAAGSGKLRKKKLKKLKLNGSKILKVKIKKEKIKDVESFGSF